MNKRTIAAVYEDSGSPHTTVHELTAPGNAANGDGIRGIVIVYEGDVVAGRNELALYPVLKDDDFRNLEGKVLTVADAVFTDQKQADAVKALFKSEMRRWFSDRIDELKQSTDDAKLIDYKGELQGQFKK